MGVGVADQVGQSDGGTDEIRIVHATVADPHNKSRNSEASAPNEHDHARPSYGQVRAAATGKDGKCGELHETIYRGQRQAPIAKRLTELGILGQAQGIPWPRHSPLGNTTAHRCNQRQDRRRAPKQSRQHGGHSSRTKPRHLSARVPPPRLESSNRGARGARPSQSAAPPEAPPEARD